MQLLHLVADARRLLDGWRTGGAIGFVPTMGALHAGHASLIEQARHECTRVVVSIFVNPLQFDRPDDLERYPRTLDADLDVCARAGVDLLFVPDVAQMYPVPPAVTVDPGRLGLHLCGAHRPGHFRGMATVVLKLLNIVAPDRAYFGQKDAQQLAIVRRMVDDFNLGVTIVGGATVREADGVALSSRNARLTELERRRAPALVRALDAARTLIADGAVDVPSIRQQAAATVADDETMRLEYLEIVDPLTLEPVAAVTGPVLVAGALWVGTTRLIDNLLCQPPS